MRDFFGAAWEARRSLAPPGSFRESAASLALLLTDSFLVLMRERFRRFGSRRPLQALTRDCKAGSRRSLCPCRGC